MALPERLRLIGATASPYTRKMLSLLRYRRIPYSITWGDPAAALDAMGLAKPKIVFHPTFLFESETGELHAVCDSTPIIRRLEQEVTERSVIPPDPALAFINYLIEDFADEWCTKYMFHYRWYPAADADNAGTLLPLAANVTLPEETLQQAKTLFTDRQVGRLGFVGSNDETAPIIDASYRRLLVLLEKHLQNLPFLLGKRPGSGDFAVLGQFTQLVGFDPTPRAIAHELSPRTVAWVGLMEDQCGLEPTDNDWCPLESLPASLRGILTEIGRVYAPALLANARALAAGQKSWEVEIDGRNWSQRTFPYQGKCLQWINEQYQALSTQDQSRVDNLLAGTGCEAILMTNE
jgi:glutathione S-transferase